jgi:hypothetical protein
MTNGDRGYDSALCRIGIRRPSRRIVVRAAFACTGRPPEGGLHDNRETAAERAYVGARLRVSVGAAFRRPKNDERRA